MNETRLSARAAFRQQRRLLLTQSPEIKGLDFVSTEETVLQQSLRRMLVLHFVPAPAGSRAVPEMSLENVVLRAPDGGRLEGVRIVALELPEDTEENRATLALRIADDDRARALTDDPRPCVLELVELPDVDRFFRSAPFRFSAGVVRDRRPAPEATRAPPYDAPPISYLAKDYRSFRTMMLDRMSFLVPEWTERNPSDLGVAIFEVLAYAGDYLSYYQDATATEAYLQTARRRISIRRLGRLVDYRLGEGCNARVWVHVKVAAPAKAAQADAAPPVLPRGSQLLTRTGDLPPAFASGSTEHEQALAAGAQVFETLSARALYPEQNRMRIYRWGAADYTLSPGATSAVLVGWPLHLAAGDLVCFEQVRNAVTGRIEDAAPGRRHAVRLAVAPSRTSDPLRRGAEGAKLTAIRWFDEDALPFSLTVAARVPRDDLAVARSAAAEMPIYARGRREYVLPAGATAATLAGHWPGLEIGSRLALEQVRDPELGTLEPPGARFRHEVRLTASGRLGADETRTQGGKNIPTTEIEWREDDALPRPLTVAAPVWRGDLALAHGNVVLADHGATVIEELPEVAVPRRYRPRLEQRDLTFRVPVHPGLLRRRPARDDLLQDPLRALPAVALVETDDPCLRTVEDAGRRNEPGETWLPRHDLLESPGYARDFVVEMDEARHASLRFGDDRYGRSPAVGGRFRAYYRVGSGPAGNVGHDAIAHVVTAEPRIAGVRNPLPAMGGVAWEPLERARLQIPRAFHSQRRCVTDSDFVTAAERLDEVRRAVARLRWNGSWNTAFVHLQRRGAKPVDRRFLARVEAHLDPLLVAGYDLAVRPPEWTALEIVLRVALDAGNRRATENRLLDAFSDRRLDDDRTGFFYPDRFTFGQPVYLSDVIERASRVPGVREVVAKTFRRRDGRDAASLRRGRVEIGAREIAVVRNDPRAPQWGTIDFHIESER